MSSLGGNHTVKLWTCCECKETGILMTLGDCPRCKHSRCIDCDVKSHIVSNAEIEEERGKVERYANTTGSLPQGLNESGSSDFYGGRVNRGSTATQGAVMSHRDPQELPQRPSTLTSDEPSAAADFIERSASPSLIPIASGIEQYPVFVLREDLDVNLISEWNRVLPDLSNRCWNVLKNIENGAKLSSIHLLRVGLEEASSQPTIIVNSTHILHPRTQQDLQRLISASLVTYENIGFPMVFLGSLRLLFRQSRVRRSVGSQSLALPPICQPRNREFSQIPGTGASIGIAWSLEDTATLGCYLHVDNKLMVLTVNHLVPTEHSSVAPITHISEQDRFELALPLLYEQIREILATKSHKCSFCDPIHSSQNLNEGILKFSKAFMFQSSDDHPRTPDICPFWSVLETKCQLLSDGKVRVIAYLHSQSGTRHRSATTTNNKIEMDWALFEVTSPKLREEFPLRCEGTFCTSSHREGNGLATSPFQPGALVRSLGRTSGHQVGQISTTMSAIYHANYTTQEWCVIKRPENSLGEWIEGGIGVEGDSGALIVDELSNAVFGMLWGRIGDGPATMTIFTPIHEIILDIREKTLAEVVGITPGQEMSRPEIVEFKKASQAVDSASITISIGEKGKQPKIDEASHAIDDFPITISIDEQGNQPVLEDTMASLDIQQSSADTRHPHSFERYRGRDRPNRSIPRSLAQVSGQEPVGNVEVSQWPGSHTYLRHAVAPEQE